MREPNSEIEDNSDRGDRDTDRDTDISMSWYE